MTRLALVIVLAVIPALDAQGGHRKNDPPGKEPGRPGQTPEDLSKKMLDKSCRAIFASLAPSLDWDGPRTPLNSNPYFAFVQIDRVLESLERVQSAASYDIPTLELAVWRLGRARRFTDAQSAAMKSLVATVSLVRTTTPGAIPPPEETVKKSLEVAAAALPAARAEELRRELAGAWGAAGHVALARSILPTGDNLSTLLERRKTEPPQRDNMLPAISVIKYLLSELDGAFGEIRTLVQPHAVNLAERTGLRPATARPATGTSDSAFATYPGADDEKKKKHFVGFFEAVEASLGRPLDANERALAARLGALNYSAGQVAAAIRRFTEAAK